MYIIPHQSEEMALILFHSCTVCFIVWIYFSLFNHFPTCGYVVHFQSFAITHNTAMNNLVQKSFYILGKIPRIGISRSRGKYTYVFLLRIIKFPSIGAVHHFAFSLAICTLPVLQACQPSRWSNFWIFANLITCLLL